MRLFNCEIDFMLTLMADCLISVVIGPTTFAISNTKHYVPVVALLAEVNAKL